MKITRIYGGSDDLIEIDGQIDHEIGCYGHKRPIKIEASDGTKATIFYDGEWKITVSFSGSKYLTVVDSVGDNGVHGHDYTIGATNYSDVLIFEEGLEWVKIKGKTYTP